MCCLLPRCFFLSFARFHVQEFSLVFTLLGFADEDIPVLFVYLQRFHTSVGDFLVLPLTTIHLISILIRNRYRNRFRLLFDQHFCEQRGHVWLESLPFKILRAWQGCRKPPSPVF